MATAAGVRSQLVSLGLSCHPLPAVAVTCLVTVLAAVAGNPWTVVLLIAAAVLCGQLSIGWSNDLLDADRDAAAARPDKPLAVGAVATHTVTVATVVAATATVPLSLALGWRAGVVHLVAVASGWSYNFGLKATALSVLPYVVTFGLFPAVATLPLPGRPWPAPWLLAAGALIGVAAHFGNVVPDLADDAAAGVRGLPHRLGRAGSSVVANGAALAAIGVVAVGGSGDLSRFDWLLVTMAFCFAAAAQIRVRRDPRSEAAFYGSMLIAAIGVALIARSGALP